MKFRITATDELTGEIPHTSTARLENLDTHAAVASRAWSDDLRMDGPGKQPGVLVIRIEEIRAED